MKLADSGGTELREEGTTMHTPEVRKVSQEVQLLGNNAITRSLSRETKRW